MNKSSGGKMKVSVCWGGGSLYGERVRSNTSEVFDTNLLEY